MLISLQRVRDKSMEVGIDRDEEDKPFFPTGLHFGTQEVAKLGLGDLDVGEEVMIVAQLVVTSVSMDKRMNGDQDHSVGFDMMSAEVKMPETFMAAASKLFGSSKDE